MSLQLAYRHRVAVDIVLALVLASGIAWLLLDRGETMDTADRAVLHTVVRIHALAGLGCVYVVGTLWFMHVRRAWRSHRNRVVGSAFLALMAVLIASGYALGYLTDEGNHLVIARLHWIAGLAAACVYLAHRWRGVTTRPSDPAASA
jgi:cation transport ATPase